MWFDDDGYIFSATVAHLVSVLIKYFAKLVGVLEVVTYSWRKNFPIFVETAPLNKGLNQIMLRCRCVFVWLVLVLLNFNSKSVYPLSPRAFSHWCLDEIKTSSLEECLDERSLIVFSNWLISCGGWFEDLWISDNKLFGFL